MSLIRPISILNLEIKSNESFTSLEVDRATGTPFPAEDNTTQKRNRLVSILMVGGMKL